MNFCHTFLKLFKKRSPQNLELIKVTTKVCSTILAKGSET